MRLVELHIRNFRNIADARLELAAGLNVFIGPNGAGKTSLLEAAYLLSHGSSFRTRQAEHLQRQGAKPLTLYALMQNERFTHRLGLAREEGHWAAKLDGDASIKLTALFSACAVTCFEPGSHALISGGGEGRRSFLDWGVFHVEHAFAVQARRYRRALRQRNVLLKQEAGDDELAVWDEELSKAAEAITVCREAYMVRFFPVLSALLSEYLPELGCVNLRFRPGWDRGISLSEALAEVRQRDRVLKHTTRGPHRADWGVSFDQAPNHEQLSRGQEKLCAIACMLAQTSLFRSMRNESPVIVFDDLCSELDAAHQKTALATLMQSGAQILLAGTEIPAALVERFPAQRLFHVERGEVRAVL